MGRYAVGLMSGTSLDGIDAALVHVGEHPGDISLVHFLTLPYTLEQRTALLRLCQPGDSSVAEICAMNFELGELFAAAVKQLLAEAGFGPEQIAVIGSHGQTIYHIPGRSTLQIGEPAVIANRTGITTVADFRPADIAAGGQGAPLIPYFDQIVFGSSDGLTAVQNIGGIGNVTLVGRQADQLPCIAFDTGPGNMVIDAIVRLMTDGALSFDEGGRLAAQGRVNHELLARLMSHPYFSELPPKTTGREVFGSAFSTELWHKSGLSSWDLLATVTAFTAESITDQYRRFVAPYGEIERVIVGGGGSHNDTLLSMLRERLNCPVYVHEDFGISSDAKEAMAFALMALATLDGKSSNVPRATGARMPAVLGKTVLPERQKSLGRVGSEKEALSLQSFRLVEEFVQKRNASGAVAMVSYRGVEYGPAAFGHVGFFPGAEPVTPESIFDLASLTKVVGTTTAVLQLLEEGVLDLQAEVGELLSHVPADKARITLERLLSHTSGLPAWAPLYQLAATPQEVVPELLKLPMEYEPGTQVVYSCMGYILLGHILETVTGTPLKELIQQRVIEPLDLKDTCYNPPEAVLPRVVYTEWCVRRKEFLRGTVHDENAQALGGVSANAGLFSTARDLAKFAQMILNRGEINGKRLLNDSTFELLSKCFTEGLNERRTLGWLLHQKQGSSGGGLLSPSAIGHTGFTGTSLWIDREQELFVILLTNRVHPVRTNDAIIRFRPAFHDAVVRELTQ